MRLIILLICCLIPAMSFAGSVERPYARYHFDGAALVERADSALTRARRQIKELLGTELPYAPDIFLASTQAEFDSLIGGSFPDWGAAVAVPFRRQIVIKAPYAFHLNKPLEELLAHEYCHLALDHRMGLGHAPRWFDEGLAMYVSMEWSWSDSFTLNRAAVFGSLPALEEISEVNRMSEDRAQVAYAESYMAVKYLLDTYGNASVNLFLDGLAKGLSLDSALSLGFAATTEEFEAEFASYLRERYNLVTLLADMVWFWIALAMVVVVGGFVKYRKRRYYYRKWQQEEQLHSTDFDWGDPDRPEQTDDDESWRR